MSFDTYVEGCMNASTSQDKLDWHFNGILREPNGGHHPLIVHLPSTSNLPSTNLCMTQDVDAFIAPYTRVIPIKDGLCCYLFLAPMSQERIDTHEYGTCIIERVNIPIKNVPHTLLLEVLGFGQLKCHISFPRMYREYHDLAGSDSSSSDSEGATVDSPPIPSGKDTFFTAEEQVHFVDFLWLPSLKKVMSAYEYSNIPSTHKHAASNGYSLNSIDRVSSSNVHLAVHEMRQLISQDESLKKYEDFFFTCSSFGSKHSFSGDLEAILGSIIDWSVLDTLNVFLDIATTITDKNRVSSLFLKSSSMYSVPSMYNLHQSDKYAFFTASLGRFGGVQVKQHVEGDDKPCKFIIYNCSKRTFAGKAKQDKFSGFAGKHFTAESLWHSCSDKKTVLTHVQ